MTKNRHSLKFFPVQTFSQRTVMIRSLLSTVFFNTCPYEAHIIAVLEVKCLLFFIQVLYHMFKTI